MIASHGKDTVKTPTPAPDKPGNFFPGRGKGNRGTIGSLRRLVVASLLIPAFFFVVAAWRDYQLLADRAEDQVQRSATMVHQHALKALEISELILREVDVLTRGMDDSYLKQHQLEIHKHLTSLTKELAEVQGIWIFDSTGRPAVSNLEFPIDQSVDADDRALFEQVKASPGTLVLSDVRRGTKTGKLYFVLARARSSEDGGFKGLIAVSAFPSYFSNFYRSVMGNTSVNRSMLVKTNGAILARYPETSPAAGDTLPQQSSFFREIVGLPSEKVANGASPINRSAWIVSYERVDPYPLYATYSVSVASMLRAWVHDIFGFAIFALASAAALLAVSWQAFVHTRREAAALEGWVAETELRRQAEDNLRQAQKLDSLGRLTGGIAHDFNNLLMVIVLNASRLMKRSSDSAIERGLQLILQAAQRGTALTNRLLAFARKESLNPSVIDVNESVAEMRELLSRTLGESVVLSIDLAPNLPPALLDPLEFETALLNLVVNARDAMPNGGTLAISTVLKMEPNGAGSDRLSGFIGLKVADTGKGIAPEIVGRVFEPFFTTKSDFGTGLGLSQVYGFAKRSGGSVEIQSAPGAGTTVEIRLPVADSIAAAEAESQKQAEQHIDLKGVAVLLVEDDALVRNSTAKSLEDYGCKVFVAGDASAAMDILINAADLDVLVSDVGLPGINGRDLAIQARKLRPDMKVILITGYSGNIGLAGHAVLSKPLRAHELAAAVRRALEKETVATA